MGSTHSNSYNMDIGNLNVKSTPSGNLAFSLLEDPKSPIPVSPRFTKRERVPRTLGEINQKLEEANDRRLALEQERLERIALNKGPQVVQNKAKMEEEWSKKVAVKTDEQLQLAEENKKNLMEEKVAKIRQHEKHVEEVRSQREGVALDVNLNDKMGVDILLDTYKRGVVMCSTVLSRLGQSDAAWGPNHEQFVKLIQEMSAKNNDVLAVLKHRKEAPAPNENQPME